MSQSSFPRRRRPPTKIKPGARRVAGGLAAVIAAAAALTSTPTAFALLRENSGTELVSVDADSGALAVVEMPRISEAQNLVVEWDGRVLIATGNRLLRVNPSAGQRSTVTSFKGRIRGLAVRRDSQIFVRTMESEDGATPSQLIRVDPGSDVHTIVTSGGHL